VNEPKQQDKPFDISKWVVWGVSWKLRWTCR